MNILIHVGRFTADPEVRYSQDGKPIAKFSMAIDRRFKREGEATADFFNYVAFGKTAEFISKYFHKGMKAVITGELRNNHYTDQQGVKHYSEQIIVSNIEFGESKKSSENNTKEDTEDTGDFMNIPDDVDLQFI